jgi:leucyl-tRNA synthetase
MKRYDFKEIEAKWQKHWEINKTFNVDEKSLRPKYYALIEFPYPSGDGLHVGHQRTYTALDIVARKRRLDGFNVLFPIGWDAFGLPTENYAIKNKIHPKIITQKNILNFKKQSKSMGFSYDWDREIDTSDPSYYKWTQWIFIKLFENGLAYKSKIPINWCPSCKIGLANEEVVNGSCARCGNEVIKKEKEQWMLKITEYAERLLSDLDKLEYIDEVKIQQKNWIGKSEGIEIDFPIKESLITLKVFTTRPETIYGVTYLVVAPEHPLLDKLSSYITNQDQINNYINLCKQKTDFERTELSKEKNGVKICGIYAINPVNKKEIPIFISDYVLMSYGTGAIMSVPGHDQRDWDFAKKYGIHIIEVIEGGNIHKKAHTLAGKLINSDFINGLSAEEAKCRIINFLEEERIGVKKVHYKLRDWVFSRQRYWGEPIPLIFCKNCGWNPVPESELPVELPDIDYYQPSDTGESPLSKINEWVNITCPVCGSDSKRETDTMPQWAGSSWYFLRYADPNNDIEFANFEKLKYWMPVNWYNGGMEHTTLHLLYSRFWHKFLFDLGLVPYDEPYIKRTSQGMILGENNEKMSKSRGNVINPDAIVEEFGADSLRLYVMFIGPFDKSVKWSQKSVKGCKRFLERVWDLQSLLVYEDNYSKSNNMLMNETIKKISMDIEKTKFNTCISALMTLLNAYYDANELTIKEFRDFLILLNPFAPHITEELWELGGFSGHIYQQRWISWDESKLIKEIVNLAISINGKVRGVIEISNDEQQENIKNKILKLEKFNKFFENKKIIKEVYIKGKIFNLVTE